MKTSVANQLLSAQMAYDELTGLGIQPIQVKDLKGTTLAGGASAWVAVMALARVPIPGARARPPSSGGTG